MKTTFKADRGHVYHIVHETKTGASYRTCWTLCGDYFEQGVRFTRAATCPNCLKLDNPLEMPPGLVFAFAQLAEPLKTKIIRMPNGPMAVPRTERYIPAGTVRDALLKQDLIDPNGELTRRGTVLAEDWQSEPTPMEDPGGVVHRRNALENHPRCGRGIAMDDTAHMTISRYEKLRRYHEERPMLVTCLACATMPS